jgi:DNA-binding NarL/FixJ family response regulator
MTETAADLAPLRVFIVDDHELERRGMRAMIGDEFDIVGEADNADSAIELILERRPDVVLLDVYLPGGGGRRVAEEVLQDAPEVAFLAISQSENTKDIKAVLDVDVTGYVLKEIAQPQLIEAIRKTSEGTAYFSSALAGYALKRYPDADGIGDDVKSLTPREREVLRYLARGYTYREIADRLFISPKTVESHTSSVYRKLRVTSRHEATNRAREQHLD